MKYDWELHKEICHRLYVKENQTLDQVRSHLNTAYGFNPSRRAFQNRLERWGYLKSKNHVQDARILNRLKELWAQNLSRPQMVTVLRKEGFLVNRHDITKLCNANGLNMRQGTRARSKSSQSGGSLPPLVDSDVAFSADESMSPPQASSVPPHHLSSVNFANPGDATRQNRFKRDRSLFLSEMTFTEAKERLNISQDEFLQVQHDFVAICNDLDVKNKIDSPEKWEEAKTELMHRRPELYSKLCTAQVEMNQRALDTMCRHICKSMRCTGSNMTQPDAKNALGLNPIEAAEARNVLSDLLKEAGFANIPCKWPTDEQWNDLKTHWGGKCPKIGKALDETKSHQDDEGDFSKKKKALDALSQDILKRLRDPRPHRRSKKQQLDLSTPVENTETQFYIEKVQTMSQQDSQSQLDGTELRDFLSMDPLTNAPGSSYTSQTMSSPDSGTITPYQAVGPSFGSQGFAMQPQQAVNPQQILSFAVATSIPGTNMPVLMPHYPPPPSTNTHPSFSGGPYASQSQGDVSFTAQEMPVWWPLNFEDDETRHPF